MNRIVRLILAVGFVLLSSLPCIGQSTPPPLHPNPSGGSQAIPQQADPCDTAQPSSLLYPLVRAYYVGGTIPGMSGENGPLKGIPWYRQAAGLQVNQYRIPGKLTLGSCHLIFAFRWKTPKKKPKWMPPTRNGNAYSVLNCAAAVFLQGSAKNFGDTYQACSDATGSTPIGTKAPSLWSQWYIIQIRYVYMDVLSRAQHPSSEKTSSTTAFAAFSAGIAAALFGLKSHNNTWFGSGALGVLGTVYYLDFVRAWQTSNYIAVFGNNNKTKNCYNRSTPAASSSKDLLSPLGETDLTMFRIKNHHDYFNVSSIITAMTGCTPTPQSPEASAK